MMNQDMLIQEMSKSMKVVILTEGGIAKGAGHITRCTSLYQAFEEKDISTEFIVNGDETVADLLRDKKCKVFNRLKEREELFGLINDADIVITDSYLADYGFYERISEMVSVPVYIDDTMRIDYPEGIVINGSLGAEDLGYKGKEDVIHLLGTRYFPLRREFRNVPEKEIREGIESVMVTFGGDDMMAMTSKILRLLVENYPELSKYIVIGKGFTNISKIERIRDKRTNRICSPDAEGMKKIMLESDIAICGGGQTLYELARVGTPAIAVAVADNQMNNVIGWRKTGFIEYAGWWEDEGLLNKITQRLNNLKDAGLRRDKSETGRKMVDGFGAERISKYLTRKYIEKDLVLRKADMQDMYTVYELANEPGVRQNSFNEETIELAGHKKWFTDRVRDEKCLFLVAEVFGDLIGQIRFDISRGEAVGSISMLSGYRGLGLGRAVMQRALDLFRLRYPDVQRIKAYIKKGNISSVNYFKGAGYQFVKKMIINNHDAFEYIYQINEELSGV